MKLIKCIPIIVLTLLLQSSSAFGSVLTIQPQLSVEYSYTDNASLNQKSSSSDFVTTISPSVNMNYSEQHVGVDFFYDYQYELYQDKSSNNSSSHNAGITGWADLSKRTKLTVGERFQRTEDPLREQDRILFPDEDPYLIRDTLVRRSREPYYTYTSNAGLTHQFAGDGSINFNYVFSTREDKAPEGNSYKQHTPAIGLTYWMTPWYGIDASVAYSNNRTDNKSTSQLSPYNYLGESTDYDDINTNLKLSRKITKHLNIYVAYNHVIRNYVKDGQILLNYLDNSPEIQTDYQIYAPSTGVSYQIDKNTSFSLGGGYFIQDRKDQKDEKGLFMDSSLTKNWKFDRSTVNLSGNSGIDRNESGYQNRGFERYYGVMGRLTYDFTRRLNGNLGVSLRRNEFINDKNNEKETRGIVNAGLSYKPTRWMTTFMDYSQSQLLSSDKSSLVTSNGTVAGYGSGTVDNYYTYDAGATFTPKQWLFITLKYSHRGLTSDLLGSGNGYTENRASITATVVPRPLRYIY